MAKGEYYLFFGCFSFFLCNFASDMRRDGIGANLLWASAGKLVTLAGGLIVGVFVARYLGPRQYGLMNYVMSYVALFQVFATFGMDAIEIREEAGCREDFNRLVGTAFYMRLALALVTMVTVVVTALFSEADMFTVLLIGIYALSVVANAFTVVRNYFTALVQNEYIARSEIARTLLGVAIKLALLWTEAPLIWFVASMTFDIFLLAAGYAMHYRRAIGRMREWYFDTATARMYVRESFPLLLTSAAVIIYQRIDQVMIGLMMSGKEALGYFSVAARIVDILVFLPAVIVNTLTPVLVRTRRNDALRYREQAQRLMDITIWSTLAACCLTSAMSYLVITVLFGHEYLPAVPILQVLSFKAVSVAVSTTAGHLLVVEGLQRWALLRDGFGCVICVLLNYLLLPRYGVLASAVVAIASNLAAGYVADAFIPAYRHLFVMQTRAIFLGWKRVVGELRNKNWGIKA